jgi:hypothetical protein
MLRNQTYLTYMYGTAASIAGGKRPFSYQNPYLSEFASKGFIDTSSNDRACSQPHDFRSHLVAGDPDRV